MRLVDTYIGLDHPSWYVYGQPTAHAATEQGLSGIPSAQQLRMHACCLITLHARLMRVDVSRDP